jgi:hypothetical protein
LIGRQHKEVPYPDRSLSSWILMTYDDSRVPQEALAT